jgi:hypothetical protein
MRRSRTIGEYAAIIRPDRIQSVRPIAFAFPIAPHIVTGPPRGAVAYCYRVRVAGAADATACVVITKTARDWAATFPFDLDPCVFGAVESDGRAVVASHVLGVDDPPMSWVVHVEGIFPDLGLPWCRSRSD